MELDLKCAANWPNKDSTSVLFLGILKRLMISWQNWLKLLTDLILKPKRSFVILEISILLKNTKRSLLMSLKHQTWTSVLLH